MFYVMGHLHHEDDGDNWVSPAKLCQKSYMSLRAMMSGTLIQWGLSFKDKVGDDYTGLSRPHAAGDMSVWT